MRYNLTLRINFILFISAEMKEKVSEPYQGGFPDKLGNHLLKNWRTYVGSSTRIVGNRQDGEDIASAAAIRIWFDWGNYQNSHDTQLQAAFHRTVRNLSLNFERDKKRHKNVSLELIDENAERHDKRIVWPKQLSSPSAESIVLKDLDFNLQSETLREAIMMLKESDILVIGFKLEELTNRDIGRILGISEGAVKSLYFRILERLREKLAELDFSS